MFRNAMYVRLVLLMLVLSAAAVFLGGEPWGRAEPGFLASIRVARLGGS